MDITRFYEGALLRRLGEKSPLIQVLIGPRQVGKTTALKRIEKEKNALYVSADSATPLPATKIEAWWNQALQESREILLIDEIQKISGWSEEIKKLWDHQRFENSSLPKLKLLLSGSSVLSLEKGLRESMAGRFELIRATHWSYEEAASAFQMSLKDYIEWGCYPGAVAFKENRERWGAYIRDAIIEPIIGRDLLQLHPIEKPALLRQVFGLALQYPAQVLSLQKIQGQLQDQGAIATIQNYLELLKGAFLVSGVEKYSPAPIRSKKSSPKLVVHENSLIRSFQTPLPHSLNAVDFGRYFENSIISRFVEAGWKTFYWNDRNLEVDAVVLGPQGEKWAIEVKSSKTKAEDYKGLKEFVKRNPEFSPKLISFVDQRISGIETLEAKEILSLQPRVS